MSLKAKMEAVIYASEEPVTLAQLMGLLGEEAQAELEAQETRQQMLNLEDLSIPDQDALNAETLQGSEEREGEDAAARGGADEAAEGAAGGGETETAGAAASEAAVEAGAENGATGVEAGAEQAVDAKAEAQAARQKERRLREYFRSLLEQLIADYAGEARGLEIREVAGGYRLSTKPEYHDAVRGFVKRLKPPLKLTLQALETLAVVAYKQPVTAPEVGEIRGVDSAGVLGSLMARKLVTTAGRKQVIGRPILYKTTKDFLLRFGLKDINELPSIEEFEKLAGELNAQEEIPMETADEAGGQQRKDEVGERGSGENGAEGGDSGGGSARLDELNAAPEPTQTLHETTEEMIGDRSAHLEGRNREHGDPREVEPATEREEAERDSGLRAEDGEATENEADEVVIDGRISGLTPDYTDDSPSAQEAREQQTEE